MRNEFWNQGKRIKAKGNKTVGALPLASCLLPLAFCLLPFAYCLLPFAYCLLPFAL
jgi:hypothetical protein